MKEAASVPEENPYGIVTEEMGLAAEGGPLAFAVFITKS